MSNQPNYQLVPGSNELAEFENKHYYTFNNKLAIPVWIAAVIATLYVSYYLYANYNEVMGGNFWLQVLAIVDVVAILIIVI